MDGLRSAPQLTVGASARGRGLTERGFRASLWRRTLPFLHSGVRSHVDISQLRQRMTVQRHAHTVIDGLDDTASPARGASKNSTDEFLQNPP